ncbi:MAG TPA: HD domain-containing phosphohydrolase [Bacillota bacterium]|nr:HD domain-containing phosphohydrolase [Bacillota bacterium]
MKLIDINEVKEYMILAKNVFDNYGKVLLSKDTVLTSNYIDRLKNFGITSVQVIDGITEEAKIGETNQKQNEAPEPDDTMDEVIRFTNNILTTLTKEKPPVDDSLHSFESLRTETFMTTNMTSQDMEAQPLLTRMEGSGGQADLTGITTNMTGNQNTASQPLLTRMDQNGGQSNLTGVTTNMRGGGTGPGAFLSNPAPKSGAPRANSGDGPILSKNIDQVPGNQTILSQAKEDYQAYKEAVATANEIKQGETIRKIAYSLLMELVSDQRIMPLLMKIKAQSETLFMHSISTCVLAIMTGMGAGYDLPVLKNLGAAALLHDIGKIYLTPELLNKKAALTKEESLEIRKHVQYGYELLQKYNDIPGMVATVTLRHHERMDGSGYPNQLKGNDINHFTRIVALADVYDNLSTEKADGSRDEIVEYIRNMSGRIFDREFAAILLKNIRFISKISI